MKILDINSDACTPKTVTHTVMKEIEKISDIVIVAKTKGGEILTYTSKMEVSMLALLCKCFESHVQDSLYCED